MTEAGKVTRQSAPRDGCWAAIDDDGLVAAVFSKEVDALRWAVTRAMLVERVRFGEDLRTPDERMRPVGGAS